MDGVTIPRDPHGPASADWTGFALPSRERGTLLSTKQFCFCVLHEEKFKEGQGRMCCNVLTFAALAYTGPQQETAGYCLHGLKQQAGAVTAISSAQARCDKGAHVISPGGSWNSAALIAI